jgi:hypothetical protein
VEIVLAEIHNEVFKNKYVNLEILLIYKALSSGLSIIIIERGEIC